jgi:hypothetical protein
MVLSLWQSQFIIYTECYLIEFNTNYFTMFHVPDPPEIEVERSWVHSGEGYEAQLVCIVHGEPAPNVSNLTLLYLIE